MPNRKIHIFVSVCILFFLSTSIYANEWRKIEDKESLEKIYHDTTLRGVSWPNPKFKNQQLNTQWHIDYCADGTGVLIFWEEKYPRTWKVTGQDQVCIRTDFGEKCYFFEESTKYKDLYRGGVFGKKKAPWVFTVINEKPEWCRETSQSN